jgi:hypothetical protein
LKSNGKEKEERTGEEKEAEEKSNNPNLKGVEQNASSTNIGYIV